MKNRRLRALSLTLACTLMFTSVDATVFAAENAVAVETEVESAEEIPEVEETPVVEETPTAEEEAPVVEEEAPAEEEQAPVVEEEAPAEEEQAPVVSEEEISAEEAEELVEVSEEKELLEINEATTVDFTKVEFDFSKADVYFKNGSELEYNKVGKYQSTLVVSIEYEGQRYALVNGKHFTAEFVNPAKTGAGKVTVKPAEGTKFTGSKTVSYTVVAAKISSSNVKLTDAADATKAFTLAQPTYDGLPWTQTGFAVAKAFGSEYETLVAGTDYTVSYKNNVNSGTATMVVTGKGAYAGSASFNFEIKDRVLDSRNIVFGASKYTYCGKEIKPTLKLVFKNRNNKEVVVPKAGYAVTYSDNVNAGTASVSVTVNTQNYSNNFFTSDFNIEKKDISKATLSYTKKTLQYGFDYDELPEPVVKLDGMVLEEDDDFDWVDNEKTTVVGELKPGIIVCDLVGCGNYTGTKKEAFKATIVARKLNASLNKTYFKADGKTVFKPEVIVDRGTGSKADEFDYKYSNEGNVKPGKYYVIVTPKENNKKYVGTKKLYYTVGAKDSVENAKVELEYTAIDYDGKQKTPNVKVTFGGKELKKNADYKVSYVNNTKVGTATVNITGTGKSFDGKTAAKFTIKQASVADATVAINGASTAGEITFSAAKKQPTFTVKMGNTKLANDKDYTVSYTYSKTEGGTYSSVSDVTNVGYYIASFYGEGNYKDAAKATVKFSVVPKNLKNCSVRMFKSSFTIEDLAKYFSDTSEMIVIHDGKVKLTSSDYSITDSNLGENRSGYFEVEGMGNYTGKAKVRFTFRAVNAITTVKNNTVTVSNKEQKSSLSTNVLYALPDPSLGYTYAYLFKIKSCKGNASVKDFSISDGSLVIPANFIGEVVIEGSCGSDTEIFVHCPAKTFKVKVELPAPTVKLALAGSKEVKITSTDAYTGVTRYEYRYSYKSNMSGAKTLKDNVINANYVGEYYYVQSRAVVETKVASGKTTKTVTSYSDWSEPAGICVSK